MNSSTSTLQSPSFSQPGQAPDQQSTRLLLQSYLQCLDRLDRLEHRVHEEIQEMRSLFRNILDNYQSNVTMEDSGGCDSTVDSQAGLDGLNVITPFGSSHDRYFMPQPAPHEASFGVMGSLSESIEGLLLNGTREFANYVTPQHSMYSEDFLAFYDPRVTESSSESGIVDARLGFSLRGTIDSIYEPAAQPFQGVYLEEHVPLDSLVGPDAQLPVPVEPFMAEEALEIVVMEVIEGTGKAMRTAVCNVEYFQGSATIPINLLNALRHAQNTWFYQNFTSSIFKTPELSTSKSGGGTRVSLHSHIADRLKYAFNVTAQAIRALRKIRSTRSGRVGDPGPSWNSRVSGTFNMDSNTVQDAAKTKEPVRSLVQPALEQQSEDRNLAKPTGSNHSRYCDYSKCPGPISDLIALPWPPKKWRKGQPETETPSSTHLDVDVDDDEAPDSWDKIFNRCRRLVDLTTKVVKELTYATQFQ
ncbi:uncharacterized protein F5891DRAFT_982746 [Suillus fuscotomentosus]|uniref:Uncharacterized protein n=1 Tax=Suillus fuscotomentosus TaxID=1912939 RepID=A0AAD4E113_9AGAM|nr:uncharacterized protein F5891DRAFT_982746 [Suillus fuscotomentosus]KAG1897362.1 hypothetical protein F5891DRAFT_982746 [Suillus fuscotomentosus]